jgi:hypothetical protein
VKVDPIRRARRVRATASLQPDQLVEDNCPHCACPESEHYVDGSCSRSCPPCEVREDDPLSGVLE